MENRNERMKELVGILSKAAESYYKYDREIMSNFEYDRLYDELEMLEKETGIVLSGSPTRQVGYETLEELPKEAHPEKMLSLDKTKEVAALAAFLGDKEGLLSWKMDGLTVVLTYEDGALTKAVTRGNGEIGEVITANARVFKNLPLTIPYKGRTVLRGEAIITYSDFETINDNIPELDAKYKNPRNLCSGSVRQLNNQITAERNVRFKAFALVEGEYDGNLREGQFEWLVSQGFEIVEYRKVTAETIEDAVAYFAEKIVDMDEPSDGLVLIYDDIAYGRSLGVTAKFPRDAIAFKWKDEIKETTLKEIEWSASRTGLINPIAVFEPVDLEGTTVSRASVHNVSIMEELKLGAGDKITVYKANMIIPQIADNLTASGTCTPPDACPVCGGVTELNEESGVKTLYCTNPDCPAKKIKSFSLFVSRNAMNIEGLSEQTLEKLTAAGIVKTPGDIFRLKDHREEITAMEGFGEKSFEKLISAIDSARAAKPARLLFGLGIPGIGSANAAMIARCCGDDWEKMIGLTAEELKEIDGVGDVMAEAYVNFFADPANAAMADDVAGEVIFEEKGQGPEQIFEGMTFVITGSLERFSNRKELQELIQDRGGKAAGSVSAKTTALINNDTRSASSKNKKAKELGIPIISEEEFCERYGI